MKSLKFLLSTFFKKIKQWHQISVKGLGFSLRIHGLLFSLIFIGISFSVQAQDESSQLDKALGEVEALYETYDEEKDKKAKTERKQVQKKEINVQNLSDLAQLAPFEDVAVIQRRFLPRTGRFELSPNAMVSLNNPFFNNLGLGFRAAYFFREKHGVELKYFLLSNTSTQVTRDLRDKRNVRTESLTVPKSYYGAAYKWSPIYGKMTLFNRQIVPFDLYFTVGGGMTQTQEDRSEGTVHLGTGQAFALSKSFALRWDLTWNFYQAGARDELGRSITNNHDDLFLSVGVSFFLPEAKYR